MSVLERLPELKQQLEAEPTGSEVTIRGKTEQAVTRIRVRAWNIGVQQLKTIAPLAVVGEGLEELYAHLVYSNDAYTRDLITNPLSSESTKGGIRQPIPPKFYHGIEGNLNTDSQPTYGWHLRWDSPLYDIGVNASWNAIDAFLGLDRNLSVVGITERIIPITEDPEDIEKAVGLAYLQFGEASKTLKEMEWIHPKYGRFVRQPLESAMLR